MQDVTLIEAAGAMVANQKGFLTMDESNPTCNKRFAALGIAQTAEMRRRYRQLLITTPGLSEGINAAILYDETVRQKLSDGRSFVQAVEDAGIIPGIKVDIGAKAMAGSPNEKITEGLDGLHERLAEYRQMGLHFAKWRAIIGIAADIPTHRCIQINASVLARYAAMCQEAGLVPIVEPEVLMAGSHSLAQCGGITEEVLHIVFDELRQHRVLLEGMILKPNMILPGLDFSPQATTELIATATVQCLLRTVPAAVPGIAFLSGGQPSILATERLNTMNKQFRTKLPWALSFSFSRALQYPAMAIWNGETKNTEEAQQALYHRAKCNQAAVAGSYTAKMEKN